MKRLKKLAYLLEQKGFNETLLCLAKYLRINTFSYSLETYAVFRTSLDKSMPIGEFGIDVEICKIQNSDKDIDELISFWPDFFRFSRTDEKLRQDISGCFECGDECFCVRYNNKIVGMKWIGYQYNYMLKSMAKKIGLNKEEVIFHRIFLDEEIRGKRIYPFLGSFLSNYAKNKGYKRWFAYVGVRNLASLRAHLRMCDEYLMLHHFQITLFGISFNFFPGYSEESKWISCKPSSEIASAQFIKP